MDRHQAERKAYEYIGSLGTIVDEGMLSSSYPTQLVVDEHPEHTVGFVLYQRFNGSWILRIELPLGKLPLAAIDRNEALDYFRLVPYATITMTDISSTRLGTNDPHHTQITLHHSIGLRSTSKSHLEEVVGTLLYHADAFPEFLADLGYREEEASDGSALAPNSASGAVEMVYSVKAKLRKADGDLETALRELEDLIGLASVKGFVAALVAQQRLAARRAAKGLPQVMPSPHLIFTGNPGTGKTTVARLIGRIYKHFGMLKSGHVIEATRSDLCGLYVGQTGPKTRALCETAAGGVLFIDEAYTLNGGGANDYGSEAIAELITYMEMNRGNIAIVVAGYTDEMEKFIDMNPGLKSRFDLTVEFPDFSNAELVTIFEGIAKSNGYRLDDSARNALTHTINSLPRGANFGNARDIRKLFNEVVVAHAQHAESDSLVELDLFTADHFAGFVEPALASVGGDQNWPGYL